MRRNNVTLNAIKHTFNGLAILVLSLTLFLSPVLAAGPRQEREKLRSIQPSDAWLSKSSPPIQLGETNTVLDTVLAPVQTAALFADDGAAMDEFGYTVAIDGNTAVIGARNHSTVEADNPLSKSGAVYVFTREGNLWYDEAKLVAKNAKAGDSFGTSVAISDNIIVVGATGVDIEEAEDAGAAYVFRRNGGAWTQEAKLSASDPLEQANFGAAVAIDGYTVVVGANTKYEYPSLDGGAAYVFRSSGGKSWHQQAKLVPAEQKTGDFFGTSVAIDGNYIVVGATEANPHGFRGTGKAYIYSRNGGKWNEIAELRAKKDRQGDFFGQSVSIFGSTVVVGALFADPDFGEGAVTNAGAAYVFVRKGDGWKQDAMLVASDGASFDEFGASVSISGNNIIVGANGKNYYGHIRAGAAYVFSYRDKTWEQQTKLATLDPYKYDDYGQSVSISKDLVLVGAPGRDPQGVSLAGEAYAMRLGSVQLPDTGFAPGQTTVLPVQPSADAYQEFGDLWLEIPKLDVRMSIVGVSRGGTGWDVRWLGDKAGYLEDTAFPTWEGNTGLAGHATLQDGAPGPFANLENLSWGDEIIIHAWGQRHIYQVRENKRVPPDDTTVLKHEHLDWITLITCLEYDQSQGEYRWRGVVRAVLTEIEKE